MGRILKPVKDTLFVAVLILFAFVLVIALSALQGCMSIPRPALMGKGEMAINSEELSLGRKVGVGNVFEYKGKKHVLQFVSGKTAQSAKKQCLEDARENLRDAGADTRPLANVREMMNISIASDLIFLVSEEGQVWTCECLVSAR